MAYFSENLATEMSYRRFDDDTTSLSEADIPLRPENRKRTDRYFLIVFILVIFALIPFLVYTLVHSDISRYKTLVNGENKRQSLGQSDIEELFGPQQTSKHSQRIPKDIRYDAFVDSALNVDADKYDSPSRYSRSVTRTKQEERKIDFSVLGWRLTFATFVSLGFCIILASMFRYATAITVWGILILVLLALIVTSLFYWVAGTEVAPAIVFSILTVVYLCVLIFLKNKIRLAIMLLKEATKATFQMQMIFAVPALIITLTLVIAVAFVTTTVFMFTAGYPTESNVYVPDNIMIATLIMNGCVTGWVLEFLAGVQYMVIGGAVTKWYFSRNKDNLGRPVFTSFYVTIKYHLGTVAFGSLIITLVSILRAVLRSLASNHRLRWLVTCFMDYIEGFLRFFTKNSYIVTAMHGTSFIQSGKQAVRLLTLNICNTLSVTSIGDFVIAVSYFLVVFLSVMTAALIKPQDIIYEDAFKLVYLFVFGISLLNGVIILGTFETAFSTLFLCVCQDFLMNNGDDKPYAMTTDLMEYLETSKKLYSKKIQEKNLPTI